MYHFSWVPYTIAHMGNANFLAGRIEMIDPKSIENLFIYYKTCVLVNYLL